MLILTRRIGETLVIGEGEEAIVVTILSICGKQVRVGVEAKKDVPVHRLEVWARIQAEKQQDLLEKREKVRKLNFGE